MNIRHIALSGLLAGALTSVAASKVRPAPSAAAPLALAPSTLPSVGAVSERFLSYNIEMVELTGGRFWKPYDSPDLATNKADLHEYRPPIDLTNGRLRKLAAALGPAYVRYSGTWANATYFSDTETYSGAAPRGYDTALTRQQWRGAVQFAKTVDAEIVTSVATSPGARTPEGRWQSDDAERLFRYTTSIGGRIAASEFANEPNLIGGTKPPANYTTSDYRRDYRIFYDWIRAASPATRILAPGAIELGAAHPLPASFKVFLKEDLLERGSLRPDAVSFHYYGGTSKRCSGLDEADAVTNTWLSSIDTAIVDTGALRDSLAAGAPLWLTETADAACGGSPWAKTFTDSFRFADQLARAARQGVQVYMHNTLAASDYGLLDEHSFAPRPNYWVAYLWRLTMGDKVLDAGKGRPEAGLRVYAQCQRNVSGGVTVLAINTDRRHAAPLDVAGRGEMFSLTQGGNDASHIALNGAALELGEKDTLPRVHGRSVNRRVSLAAGSISFITLPAANNAACQAP